MYHKQLIVFFSLVFFSITGSGLYSVDVLDKVMENKTNETRRRRTRPQRPVSKKRKTSTRKTTPSKTVKKKETPPKPVISQSPIKAKISGLGVRRDGWIEEEFSIEPSHLPGIEKKEIAPPDIENIEPTPEEEKTIKEKGKSFLEDFDLLANDPLSKNKVEKPKPTFLDKLIGFKNIYIIIGLFIAFIFFRIILSKIKKGNSKNTISRFRKN